MSILPDLPEHATASGPFSPTPLARLPIARPIGGDAAPRDAQVTAGAIPDGHALPPSARARPSQGLAAADLAPPDPVLTALHGDAPPTGVGLTRRPAARQTGLRLIPAEGFVWGARIPAPRPRTRGDHVLIWVTAGAMALDYPAQRQHLRPGSVTFIPAGTAFSTQPHGGTRGHVLLIAPALLGPRRDQLPRPVSGQIGTGATALGHALGDLSHETQHPDDPGARAAMDCLLGLIAVQLRRLAPPPPRPTPRDLVGPDLDLVSRFLKLAGDHLASGLTVADLACQLGVDSATLDAHCRKARGRRAIDLIHDLRHDGAVQALRHGRDDMAKIAARLGFASTAHFTRSFVARTGRLPDSFRRRA